MPPPVRVRPVQPTRSSSVTRPDADDRGAAVQSAFDELGRISFAELSLDSVLHRVTELAARVLPGEPVTSLTILQNGNPSTVAASGALALDLDEAQYRLGAGPCLSAAATGAVSVLPDPQA